MACAVYTTELAACWHISNCAVKSKCKWTKQFIMIMKLHIFFSGQNKIDMKASLVKLSTSLMGNMFCDTSKEELAGRKAKEEHWREEGGCGIMWKGKAAAEKWGRMLVQAGEQLGKMREVAKRVRQSWKISFHDIAVMWQNPYAGMISMKLSAQPCFLRWAGICGILEYEPN